MSVPVVVVVAAQVVQVQVTKRFKYFFEVQLEVVAGSDSAASLPECQ